MKGFTKTSSTFGKTFRGENGSLTRGSGDFWVARSDRADTCARQQMRRHTIAHKAANANGPVYTDTQLFKHALSEHNMTDSSFLSGPRKGTWGEHIDWLLALSQSPPCKMGLLMSLTSTMFQHLTITRATWHAHRYGQRLLPELYIQVVLISARVWAALGYGSNDTVAPWKH